MAELKAVQDIVQELGQSKGGRTDMSLQQQKEYIIQALAKRDAASKGLGSQGHSNSVGNVVGQSEQQMNASTQKVSEQDPTISTGLTPKSISSNLILSAGPQNNSHSPNLHHLRKSSKLASSSSQDPKDSQNTQGMCETWIVQEYCDMGSLSIAKVQQLLQQDGEPKLPFIIRTAMDIARGMVYLHRKKVLHGDLKATNVLLASSAKDFRGFTAKVSDFGLSKKINGEVVLTRTIGTVTHMPPELLLKSKFSFKGDVYSFGVILWELVEGRPIFQDTAAGDIIRRLILLDERPQFACSRLPAEYINLVRCCWATLPDDRPTFEQVLKLLEDLWEMYGN